jgi:hypothetical protein
MRIDRIKILNGEGPVSVNASLTKVKVLGFSKVKVTENQVSNKDYSWITTVKLPKMRLEGNYHMTGRILVIPLNVSDTFVSLVADNEVFPPKLMKCLGVYVNDVMNIEKYKGIVFIETF